MCVCACVRVCESVPYITRHRDVECIQVVRQVDATHRKRQVDVIQRAETDGCYTEGDSRVVVIQNKRRMARRLEEENKESRG